jgi:hypothetical protein
MLVATIVHDADVKTLSTRLDPHFHAFDQVELCK